MHLYICSVTLRTLVVRDIKKKIPPDSVLCGNTEDTAWWDYCCFYYRFGPKGCTFYSRSIFVVYIDNCVGLMCRVLFERDIVNVFIV